MLMVEGQCYAAWLKAHGLVFFRVVDVEVEHIDVELLRFSWRSDGTAQHYRTIFEDARAMREAAMMSSVWWPHVETITIAEAPVTSIRLDQLGWWTAQPWLVEKLPEK